MQAPREPSTLRNFRTATLAAALSAGAVALVWAAPQPALDGASAAIEWLRDRDDTAGRTIATTVLVALAALGYVLAWARASSPRRPVRVGDDRGAIPVDELAGWLRDAVLARPDVCDAVVRVENLGRRGVRVALVLGVTPQARLAETAADTSTRVEEALRERAGLQLEEPPAIELRYEELILGPREQQTRGSNTTDSDAA